MSGVVWLCLAVGSGVCGVAAQAQRGRWPTREAGVGEPPVTPAPADYQVVFLPALLPRAPQTADGRGREDQDDDVAIDYSFDALGRNFELKLVPNRRLLSPHFKVFTGAEGERQNEELSNARAGCHYLHNGGGAVAAISACQDQHLHGLIFVDNTTYELQPLASGHTRRWDTWGEDVLELSSARLQKLPHLIRKAPPLPERIDDPLPLRDVSHLHQRKSKMSYSGPYTVEVALFFDEAAYKLFYPYFNYNERDLRDMLLAYVNGVQALYHHPSLGSRVELSLVRLQLMRSQPPGLPTHGGERSRLLDSFCAYQKSLNNEDDAHPDHWDMALLLSGLDFYAMENGRRSGVTMGLAPVGGVCLAPHSCVVAEMGTGDYMRDWPSPAAGFSSVYVLAHEIGHNLGMSHDSSGNSCARNGFIMSPSRGYSGEALWSSCSAQVVQQLGRWAHCLQDRPESPRVELAHETHRDAPGLTWGVKKQCEMFLRDRDAAPAARQPDVCRQLACRTPHRPDFFFAGPALPGTVCGDSKWCQGGECVAGSPLPPPAATTAPTNPTTTAAPAGWSGWREGACRSGCVLRSRGHRLRRRTCQGRCEGSDYDVALCDDTKVCGKKTRVNANEFASRKCSEFASKLPALDARGGGLQAPHDPTRMWMGCAIFCRRGGTPGGGGGGGGYYAPRVELNEAGADPYFPDGTWCHRDDEQDYYCLQHHCLPENFKLTAKYQFWEPPAEMGIFSSIHEDLQETARHPTTEVATVRRPRPYAHARWGPHGFADIAAELLESVKR